MTPMEITDCGNFHRFEALTPEKHRQDRPHGDRHGQAFFSNA
jgi:hypothetical protein